jgi:hypothetical protein
MSTAGQMQMMKNQPGFVAALDLDADYKERKFWDGYIEAYEEALSRCSTERAPWFIIPADCKW